MLLATAIDIASVGAPGEVAIDVGSGILGVDAFSSLGWVEFSGIGSLDTAGAVGGAAVVRGQNMSECQPPWPDNDCDHQHDHAEPHRVPRAARSGLGADKEGHSTRRHALQDLGGHGTCLVRSSPG